MRGGSSPIAGDGSSTMTIRVDRKDFCQAIAMVTHAASTDNHHVLTAVHFSFHGESLVVEATDRYVATRVVIPAQGFDDADGTSWYVHAPDLRGLSSILKGLDGVYLDVGKNEGNADDANYHRAALFTVSEVVGQPRTTLVAGTESYPNLGQLFRNALSGAGEAHSDVTHVPASAWRAVSGLVKSSGLRPAMKSSTSIGILPCGRMELATHPYIKNAAVVYMKTGHCNGVTSDDIRESLDTVVSVDA